MEEEDVGGDGLGDGPSVSRPVSLSPRVVDREDCLTVCLSALGPYPASFLTNSNLESTVSQLRFSPGRKEWGFKCESGF